jgi:protein ATS1
MSSLFALGSNGSGQLGIGHEEDVNIPTRSIWLENTLNQSNVKQVVAGGNHTLILFADGRVYCSGTNDNGRCFGRTSNSQNINCEFHPAALEKPFVSASFVLCAATWEASIGVLQDGRVICCGTGNRGELGLGQDVSSAPSIHLIPDFPPAGTTVVDLAASMNHVVALLSNGEIYGWGAGRKGQLGTPQVDCWTPRKIHDVSMRAKRVVVGTNFTYIVGNPQTGEHMVIGSDKWAIMSSMPKNLPSWTDVAATWGSIFVLLGSGELLSWGRNDHSQLCPPNLSKIKAMTAGSEHVVCVTESGQVMAWGWGEHGNCGPEVIEPSFDSRGSILPVVGDVTFVGAGCATSWIGISAD